MYNLADMYSNGNGVPQNYLEAAKWYRLAANQDFAQAQVKLAEMYLDGQGLRQSDAEAVKWYRLAADRGDATAQYDLGVSYDEGRGVPQNYVDAHMWFNLAAAQGDQDAVRERDSITRKMNLAQIAEAQKLAREWKSKSTSSGLAPSGP
jgi:TPR repeat protein